MESGGVYFLVSHVLGSKFGGALGLLYVFGQVCIVEQMASINISSSFVSRNFLTRYVTVSSSEKTPCHKLIIYVV
jgi:amino acid transporter